MLKNIVKTVIYLLTGILIMAGATSCNDSSREEAVISYRKSVLVYMIADNSLSSYAQENIDGMVAGMRACSAGSNLLIYVDKASEVPQLIQVTTQADGTVKKTVVKSYDEQNSASPTVMSTVISDMVKCSPSQSYGLVLWSHGYGWLPGGGNTKTIPTRWFGQDGSNYMDIPDLVTALNAGPHFDYILFDACFMGGVETGYALRNNASYIIASPCEVMADGFPYDRIMASLLGTTETDYIQVATIYYGYYKGQSATGNSYPSAGIGCLRCSELDTLARETATLIASHAASLNTFSASSVQPMEGYSTHLFYDFGDFIRSFTTESERSAFEQQLSRAVVYKASTPSVLSSTGYGNQLVSIRSFSGLNTYIPQSGLSSQNTAYHSTEWYTAAGWNSTQW
jgi:hypothetical protein